MVLAKLTNLVSIVLILLLLCSYYTSQRSSSKLCIRHTHTTTVTLLHMRRGLMDSRAYYTMPREMKSSSHCVLYLIIIMLNVEYPHARYKSNREPVIAFLHSTYYIPSHSKTNSVAQAAIRGVLNLHDCGHFHLPS